MHSHECLVDMCAMSVIVCDHPLHKISFFMSILFEFHGVICPDLF